MGSDKGQVKMNFKCWNCGTEMEKSDEEYWRITISNKILNAINSGTEINAYGAYLIAQGKK
jgi:transcription initiation factor IIE alpha subunit